MFDIWGVLFGKRFQTQAVSKIGFKIISEKKKGKKKDTADKTEEKNKREKERERERERNGDGVFVGGVVFCVSRVVVASPSFRCLATRSWYGRPESQRGWTTGNQGLRVALVVGYCMVAAATNSSSNIAAVDAVCLVLLLVGSRLSKTKEKSNHHKNRQKKKRKKRRRKTERKKASKRKKNKMQRGNNLLHMPAGLLVSNLDQ